jgi:hypothetical protein
VSNMAFAMSWQERLVDGHETCRAADTRSVRTQLLFAPGFEMVDSLQLTQCSFHLTEFDVGGSTSLSPIDIYR